MTLLNLRWSGWQRKYGDSWKNGELFLLFLVQMLKLVKWGFFFSLLVCHLNQNCSLLNVWNTLWIIYLNTVKQKNVFISFRWVCICEDCSKPFLHKKETFGVQFSCSAQVLGQARFHCVHGWNFLSFVLWLDSQCRKRTFAALRLI